jgi:ABC-2 type transport system permease protein
MSIVFVLLRRDLTVLRRHLWEFVARTLIQPLLLTFVFLYLFPTIGQGVGVALGTGGQVTFATTLVPAAVGLGIMFQGLQAVAVTLAQELDLTHEMEDRALAPCATGWVAVARVISGSVHGLISAALVLPLAYVVHAHGAQAQLAPKPLVVLTLIPLACVTMSSLGLLLGTAFRLRNLGLIFGFFAMPMIFLGATYYRWTSLGGVTLGGVPWLKIAVLANPLLYVNEGLRAALTSSEHLPLLAVYPVLCGFCIVFLAAGVRLFNRRIHV